jgi:hypothetical protein
MELNTMGRDPGLAVENVEEANPGDRCCPLEVLER